MRIQCWIIIWISTNAWGTICEYWGVSWYVFILFVINEIIDLLLTITMYMYNVYIARIAVTTCLIIHIIDLQHITWCMKGCVLIIQKQTYFIWLGFTSHQHCKGYMVIWRQSKLLVEEDLSCPSLHYFRHKLAPE